jgi:primosomal protein N' (replication factor Y) (superfamily II helicase)
MAEFAEVVLNLPVDRAFTYRIPEPLRDLVRPGVRVNVPFRNRAENGYVVRLADRAEFPRIRDIVSAQEDVTADERLLDLSKWIAARYACSWGEAVAAMIPSGVKKARPGRMLRLVSAGSGDGKTARQKAIVELARKLEAPLLLKEFAKRAGASTSAVTTLIKSGALTEILVRPEIDAMADAIVEKPKDIRLTPAQEEALAAVEKGGVVLLHGVTGSGKTEVYLRSIARTVEQGRQAIVLVPEIALTPQTVSRFKARFARVAVLHSVLTEADRAAQWRAIRAGEIDVVVGARSAVFAPAKALGLIVLDEEHEAAYKQDSVPRYHAREVAVERARREGATVILGSATPSLESIHLSRQGAYRLARLPARIEGREMPEIEIVDMTAEKADLKRYPIISRRLEQLMQQAMERGEQAILFLNRRGYLTHISCPRCRWFFSCRRCDVAMTFHKETGKAVCHYCYDAQPLPESCPDCGFYGLQRYGIGTEKIEDEVKRAFPGFTVSRMDSDSMKTRKNYRDSLQALWGGETDILVGTQMIAKGLDVPDVTLVGIVSADTAFHIPDFRAAERTFQLVTQVAGRTGRSDKGGRVVLQTFYPQHYAIKAAATYDYAGFLAKELEMREELNYPPFFSLVRILVHGWNEKRVQETAAKLGEKLRATFDETRARILGPAVAPLYKIKGRFRIHLLAKIPDLHAVLPALRRVVDAAPNDRTLQAVIDVDPINLL